MRIPESHHVRLLLLLVGVCVSAFPGGAAALAQDPAPVPQAPLTLIWHEGDRADLLLKIAKEYTRDTGVEIRAILPPLTSEYHDRIAREFANRGSGFDLAIFDSQSMPEFASQGHVVLLNEMLLNSRKLKPSDFDALALQRYSEYPAGSGNIYALPINQDCMGLVYRKDLFGNPVEQAAFLKKYGYELAVPETYDQLRDIAEFFTRPEQGLYGIALYGSEDYDAATSVFNNVLWSFGAELWDPGSGRVSGHLNSSQAKAALAFYKDLFLYAPPGFRDAYVPEVNRAVTSGKVAMGIQWFYYFNDLSRGASQAGYELGFAPLPGQRGSDGTVRRFVMVGGQGVSISQYSAHKDQAWKFLEWFLDREQQWKWVRGGGMTGLSTILRDPEFLSAAPPNGAFVRSIAVTKDYWSLPAYPELLRVYQHYVHQALAGSLSPDQALDSCAREQESILESAGLGPR
jgi:multiple sugar transport system substrate-binding protein